MKAIGTMSMEAETSMLELETALMEEWQILPLRLDLPQEEQINRKNSQPEFTGRQVAGV